MLYTMPFSIYFDLPFAIAVCFELNANEAGYTHTKVNILLHLLMCFSLFSF